MTLNELHERMLRNVFLNTELLINDAIHDLAEYDIQAFMFTFFRRALANTNRSAKRESSGKVDCVVEENWEPVAFYELKTYFKKHEAPKKKHFDVDISKLARILAAHPGAKGYFVIAGRKAAFTEAGLKDFPWLQERLHQNSRVWRVYQCNDGGSVRLRPSQMQHRGRSVALSWEIKSV